jgi:hypothetical protein
LPSGSVFVTPRAVYMNFLVIASSLSSLPCFSPFV